MKKIIKIVIILISAAILSGCVSNKECKDKFGPGSEWEGHTSQGKDLCSDSEGVVRILEK